MRVTINLTKEQIKRILVETIPNYFAFQNIEEVQLYIDYFEKELINEIFKNNIEDIDAYIRKKQETIQVIDKNKEDYGKAVKLFQNGNNVCNKFMILRASPKLKYFIVKYF